VKSEQANNNIQVKVKTAGSWFEHDFTSRPQFDDAVLLNRDESWPRITIVTPSYNQGCYLEQTILSVLNQNYPNLEFIIMDGGSSDNSINIIRKYEKYLAHWQSYRDSGQAAAIADGFRLGTGQVLAYLNSDDIYLPGTLKKVGTFFNEHTSAQFIYGDCLLIDASSTVIRRTYPIEFDRDIFLYESQIIPQQSAFWRKEIYLKVGEIKRALSFCMDYDLFMEFMLAGITFVRIKDVFAAFRLHGDSKSCRMRSVHDREYHEILAKVIGRPIRSRDYMKIPYLRLKRYCQEPQGFIERLRSCLRSLVPNF
jgi:glycosyltransferase involved in cell wall biosynthesis